MKHDTTKTEPCGDNVDHHTQEPGKTCSVCGAWKPFPSFSRNAASPDDRKSMCIACDQARVPKTEAERQAERDRRRLPRNRVEFKRCRGCHRVRAAEEFHYSPNTLDGLVTRCKPCERERYQERKRRNLARRRAEQSQHAGTARSQ